MSKDAFKFKQFTIHQDRCAMKVGTDGTLLGAWASALSGTCRILDIGTGTGLIALMMAQRFPEAQVVGLDIDGFAVCQAKENVKASPFNDRISMVECDISDYHAEAPFEVIVSNPPFFVSSLECPDSQRTRARHTSSLTFETLFRSVSGLLSDTGRFSLIIPSDYRSQLESEAAMVDLFVTRICGVRTTPQKPVKRYMLEFRKHPVPQISMEDGVLETAPLKRSEWYQSYVKDFYIK
jgi:tRNA1Val (adenine37-N6)-methyltransferase